ncbi:hypothetical protein [Streptomyces sp. NPDC001348]
MGERQSGGGVPGRRRAHHPDGAVSGPWDAQDTAALETVLATALRGGDPDPVAEQRAMAAFRSAHGTGEHRARTRRRDDWRAPAERRAGRRVRMTLGMVFAGLTLSGVAVAAIGSAGSSTDGAGTGRQTAHPSAPAPGGPDGTAPSASPGGPRPTDGPARARDTEAHCRAYEQVEDRGKALEAKAWQRLVADAGGKEKVAAYCSRQLARATATARRPADAGGSGGNTANAGNGTGGGGTGAPHRSTTGKGTSGNGTSGNGTSGKASGGTDSSGTDSSGGDSSGGDSRANGGQGSGKHK